MNAQQGKDRRSRKSEIRNPKSEAGRRRAGWCLLARATGLGLALAANLAEGQQGVVVKNFQVVLSYYPPPHIDQMKSRLQGGEAQQQPDGRELITAAKLDTFREDGAGQLTVEAPQCFYDNKTSSVSSPGPVQAQTADGQYSLSGEGFLWQTNSSLHISNRVHTIVRRGLVEAASASSPSNSAATNANPIDIFSDQFDYETNSGLGTYRGNVRVTGTNLAMTGGTLTFKVPLNEGLSTDSTGHGQLQELTAEQKVIIDYEGVHATSERATYSTGTGLARMSGHPAWRTNQWEGRGEELLIDRTNKILRTKGQAYLKMPGQSVRAAGVLLSTNLAAADSAGATNQVIEIVCEDYEIRTNWAAFHKSVEVAERQGNQVEGTMICGTMTTTFTKTNQLDQLVAEENVVIQHADQQFTGEKAVYRGTNGVMELTGHPAWQAGLRAGKGDLIVVQTNEMVVRGNASMRLPAQELAQEGTPSLPATAQHTNPPAKPEQFAEIFSEEYSLRPTNAFFRGGVLLTHPQMNWVCETVAVDMSSAGETSKRIVGEQGVVFDLIDETGQKTHGTGDKAVYAYAEAGGLTNETITLTGAPAMLQKTNDFFQNNIIILDRVHQKLVAPGKFRMYSQADGVITNNFRLLRNPRSKSTPPRDGGLLK